MVQRLAYLAFTIVAIRGGRGSIPRTEVNDLILFVLFCIRPSEHTTQGIQEISYHVPYLLFFPWKHYSNLRPVD